MDQKLCRLCLGTENLLHIFNGEVVDDMAEIIHVTSGVQILRTDAITQMVCSTCCQITIKMFKFRNTSMKNDKDLKARHADYKLTQLANSINQPPENKKNISKLDSLNPIAKTAPSQKHDKYKFAHPSIKQIIKENPGIILSDIPMKSHFGAYITLMTDEVDDWFKERNISESEVDNLKWIASLQCSEISGNQRKRSRTPSLERIETKKPKSSNNKSEKSIDVLQLTEKVKVHEVSSNNVTIKKNARKSPATGSEKSVKETCKNLLFDILNKSTLKATKSAESIIFESVLKTAGIGCRKLSSDTIDVCDKSDQIKSAQMTSGSKQNEIKESQVNKQTQSDLDQVNKSSNIEKSQKENKESELQVTQPPSMNETNAHFNVVPSLPNSEGEKKNNIEAHGSKSNSSWECDPAVWDGNSCTSTSSYNSSNNPNEGPCNLNKEFINALPSEPMNSDQSNNTSDLALVSFATKSHRLYICKTCDSHYQNRKDLKRHQRRAHTTCTFCFKRFRTEASRCEHIKNSCELNMANLKEVDIQLVRVDEDEKIRKKYPTAFEREEEEDEAVESFAQFESEKVDESTELSKDLKNSETLSQTTLLAHNTILRKPEENFQKDLSKGSEKLTPEALEKQTFSETLKELEKSKAIVQTSKQIEPNKTVVSKDAFEDGNRTTKQTTDNKVHKETDTLLAIREIEKFIRSAEILGDSDHEARSHCSKPKESEEVICISDDENESNKETLNITNSKESKMILNINLLDTLRNTNASDADVIALVKKALAQRKGVQLKENLPKDWEKDIAIVEGNTPKMKIFKNLRKYLHYYKVPIQIKYSPEISVEYKPVMPPPEMKTSDLWSNMIPLELKRPIAVSIPTIIKNKTNTTTTSSQNGTVLQSQSVSNPQVIAQFSPLRTAQNKLTGSTSLVFTSRPSTSNANITQTYTTSPIILNGTPTMGNSNNTITNIILVPSNLLTAPNQANLPSTQGPLPIIQSVRSLDEEKPNSTKITFNAVPQSVSKALVGTSMYQTKNVKTVSTKLRIIKPAISVAPNQDASKPQNNASSTTTSQAAIRVKNLSELS